MVGTPEGDRRAEELFLRRRRLGGREVISGPVGEATDGRPVMMAPAAPSPAAVPRIERDGLGAGGPED